MNLTLLFLIFVSLLILFKTKEVIRRNNLSEKKEKLLLTIISLIVILMVTNITLPYPQSLYWFLSIGLITSISIFFSSVIKHEYKRFSNLTLKDRILDGLFYCLLIITFNIYI